MHAVDHGIIALLVAEMLPITAACCPTEGARRAASADPAAPAAATATARIVMVHARMVSVLDRLEQKQRLPLGRMASAGEVAAFVVFLASDRAAYVTGTTISVDGGGNPVVL